MSSVNPEHSLLLLHAHPDDESIFEDDLFRGL
jgi:LmbE family N-acetylglucosaminyl deacetylase